MTEIRATIAECLPHKDVLERPDYTEAELQAIRALAAGNASERQQILALEYMIRAFGTHDISYRPDDPYATAFAEGKRFAGTTLVWMLKSAPARTDPDKIATREMKDDRADNR
jgi:hypothetical protein